MMNKGQLAKLDSYAIVNLALYTGECTLIEVASWAIPYEYRQLVRLVAFCSNPMMRCKIQDISKRKMINISLDTFLMLPEWHINLDIWTDYRRPMHFAIRYHIMNRRLKELSYAAIENLFDSNVLDVYKFMGKGEFITFASCEPGFSDWYCDYIARYEWRRTGIVNRCKKNYCLFVRNQRIIDVLFKDVTNIRDFGIFVVDDIECATKWYIMREDGRTSRFDYIYDCILYWLLVRGEFDVLLSDRLQYFEESFCLVGGDYEWNKCEMRQFDKDVPNIIYGDEIFGNFIFAPHTNVLKHYDAIEQIFAKFKDRILFSFSRTPFIIPDDMCEDELIEHMLAVYKISDAHLDGKQHFKIGPLLKRGFMKAYELVLAREKNLPLPLLLQVIINSAPLNVYKVAFRMFRAHFINQEIDLSHCVLYGLKYDCPISKHICVWLYEKSITEFAIAKDFIRILVQNNILVHYLEKVKELVVKHNATFALSFDNDEEEKEEEEEEEEYEVEEDEEEEEEEEEEEVEFELNVTKVEFKLNINEMDIIKKLRQHSFIDSKLYIKAWLKLSSVDEFVAQPMSNAMINEFVLNRMGTNDYETILLNQSPHWNKVAFDTWLNTLKIGGNKNKIMSIDALCALIIRMAEKR